MVKSMLLYFVIFTAVLQIWYNKKLRTFRGIFLNLNLSCVKQMTTYKSGCYIYFNRFRFQALLLKLCLQVVGKFPSVFVLDSHSTEHNFP